MNRTIILEWINQAGARFGDRACYCCGDATISFADVTALSRVVGTALTGVTPPAKPVAVMTGRHVYTPVCYLGVAQAGCFYAPMDAELPDARLRQMIEVANADVMIADKEGLARARELGFTGTLLAMEELLAGKADDGALEAAQAAVTDFSPLYMIFTSGSTGKPKGVLTGHYSLFCYLDGLNQFITLNESDVLGNQAPLDYIAAIRDIYLPLMTGARTVIIPTQTAAMPKDLFRLLNAEGVTTLCWSAAGLELPAKLGAFQTLKPEHLKRIVFSGSVIAGKYLKIWQSNLPGVRFFNQYGPTEATASCTIYEVTEEVTDETVLPIGKPFKHYSILLLAGLDEEGETIREAEPGETGEICVRGPAVTLGYYRAPEQTAKSFRQNPLHNDYRDIIYLTGDRGRFREDGELEFLGRKDRQIKLMGHRVELTEVEKYALEIEGVEEACAAFEKKKELLYLFYTGEMTPKDLTIRFRGDMPAYMVPRRLVKLEEWPRLPNGKTDMRTLNEKMTGNGK